MKTKIFRKFQALIIIFAVFTTTFVYTSSSYAGLNSLVGEYFSNMVASSNSGGPGYYQSQGENIYTLGYNEVHWNTPESNIQLFSITPPSISMGCSGIDEQWGAFQMLGGNLMKVLNSLISSGAVVSFAFNMALGVLCKQCQAIMNQLEGIANKLNGLNFNSCSTAEAVAGYAGHELANLTNFNNQSGQNNSWLSGLSTDLSRATTAVSHFTRNINCAISTGQEYYAELTQGQNNPVSCGVIKAEKMFLNGSLLRKDAARAHIGLIQGTQPGSGGYAGLLGIIRGSFTGDIFGYGNNSKRGEAIKYVPPIPPIGENGDIEKEVHGLIYGGRFNSLTFTAPAVGTSGTLSQYENWNINECFAGYYPVYASYLFQIANNLNMGFQDEEVASACQNVNIPQLSNQEEINFISSTPIPVYQVIKLAYVLQQPDIILNSSEMLADGSAYQFISELINALTENSGAYKDIGNKDKMRLINTMTNRLENLEKQLRNQYLNAQKQYNTNTKYLDYLRLLDQQVQSESKVSHLGFANYQP